VPHQSSPILFFLPPSGIFPYSPLYFLVKVSSRCGKALVLRCSLLEMAVTHIVSASGSPALSSPSLPTPTSLPNYLQSEASYSSALGTIVALTCVLLFLLYLGVVILTYRYARNHPRGVNKVSGVRLQTAAPGRSHFPYFICAANSCCTSQRFIFISL